jgi:hypothetical protein
MSTQRDPNSVAGRDHARARLGNLTRVALLATAGATVGIGIVVAHEHPGKSAAGTTASGRSSAGSGSSSNTGDTGTSSSADTGSSGDTGNTGASSFSPSISSQRPSVTSGGTSR